MTMTGTIQRDAATAAEWSFRRRMLIQITAALVLITVLAGLFPSSSQGGGRSPRRTSLSKRSDGFFAIHAVLEELGYRPERHFRSYGQLPNATSTLLVTLDPLHASFLRDHNLAHMDSGQASALERWVRRGGCILGTLPGRNMMRVGFELVEQPGFGELDAKRDALLATWPGSFPDTHEVAARGRIHARPGLRIEPGRLHLDDRARSIAPSYVSSDANEPLIPAFDADLPEDVQVEVWLNDAPLVISTAVGDGRVYLAASGFLFCNYGLGVAQLGPLAVSLIDLGSDRGRRAVLFDEFAHGLGQRRGIWWWAMNSDLRYPLFAVLIMAIALAWRGLFRLGSPRPELVLPRRAVEEFVVSLADLSRRAGRRRDAARRILRAYASRIRSERGAVIGVGANEWPPELRSLATELRSGGSFDRQSLQVFVVRAEKAYRTALTS